MTSSLKSYRSTFAEILAYTLLKVFPGTKLGKAYIGDTHFSYRVQFPQEKHPELLSLLEESMRGFLKNPLPFESIEMATKSAIGYFEHRNQPYKVEELQEVTEVTVPLIRIGDFYDFIHFPLNDLDYSSFEFKLFDFEEIQEGEDSFIEILGTCFPSKEELKAFIKKRKQWLKEMPWKNAEKEGLIFYHEQGSALLPKGVAFKETLKALWNQRILAHGQFAEVYISDQDLLVELAYFLKKPLAIFDIEGHDLCFQLSCAKELKTCCISSLQFIDQTFKMLELTSSWVLSVESLGDLPSSQGKLELKILTESIEACGFAYTVEPEQVRSQNRPTPTLRLKIVDSLGELLDGPYLSLNLKAASIEYSLFGQILPLIALLREHQVDVHNNVGRVKQLES